jgi:hypothetical protein
MRNRKKLIEQCMSGNKPLGKAVAKLWEHYETPLIVIDGEFYCTDKYGLNFGHDNDAACIEASKYSTIEEYLKDHPDCQHKRSASRQIFTTTRNYPIGYLILDELECGDLSFGYSSKIFCGIGKVFKHYGNRHEFTALYEQNLDDVLIDVWDVLYGKNPPDTINDDRQYIEVVKGQKVEQCLAIIKKHNLKLEKFDDYLIFGNVT